MCVEVIKAYKAQYDDPISFQAGATIEVLRGDSEFPGWFWCRAPSGKEGWVHESFLDNISGTAKSTRPYSARELTVKDGARGRLTKSLDGWVHIRLDSGEEGWLPQSHVRASIAR